MRKAIEVSGVKGMATVIFPIEEWLSLNPLARVLALHEAARDVLDGKRFEIISERRV